MKSLVLLGLAGIAIAATGVHAEQATLNFNQDWLFCRSAADTLAVALAFPPADLAAAGTFVKGNGIEKSNTCKIVTMKK